jgi:colanic acid/amylovoran biosynthesis glycosyltransferase
MRVAYFTNQYPAITHTFIRREIKALEMLGVTVVRYALRSSSDQLVDVEDNIERQKTKYILSCRTADFLRSILGALLRRPLTIIILLWQAAKIGWFSDRGLMRHLAYAAEAIILAEWCRYDDVQHVHAHFGTNPAVVAMLASQLTRIPYSFTAHGPEEFEKAPIISLRQKLEHAAFVVCISSFGRSQLMRWSKPDQWKKIALVRCGLDSDFFADPPPPSFAPRFVCVGRLSVEKGQLILIEAVRQLHDAGVYCEVVFVGDGPMRKEIESAIKGQGLERQITITGWVSGERVKAELVAARALVLASFSEGLPVVLMEAMAFGRPVISTYIAGIPELVEPGNNGWLVPASDRNALAQAMQQALSLSVEQLSGMGAACRARVMELHNINTEAEKLNTLFEMHSVTRHTE